MRGAEDSRRRMLRGERAVHTGEPGSIPGPRSGFSMEPIEQLNCPLCGRGMKVARPRDAERFGFQYECKCGFADPVVRMDEQGNYVYADAAGRAA